MIDRPPAARQGRFQGDEMVEAPGRPGIPARWTSSAKDGVGAALSERSRVWLRSVHGIVNEIYFPRVDQACVRDLGLIATDGDTFFAEVKRDCQTVVERIEDGVPAFRLTEHASRRPIPDDQSRDHGPAQRFGRSAHSPRRLLEDGVCACSPCSLPISLTRGRTTTASVVNTRGTRCSVLSAAGTHLAMVANPQFLARSVGFVGGLRRMAAASRPWAADRPVRHRD